MILKIYVDNYKCLTNFTAKPTSFQLWLGDNGAGKSTVCEVLQKIQSIISGENINSLFTQSSLTMWDTRKVQTFELEIQLDIDKYVYSIIVEHERKLDKCRIKKESLLWNGHQFYGFDGNEAELYRLQGDEVVFGTSFPADWSRSCISSIAERNDNKPLIAFKSFISSLLIVKPIPALINPIADSESRTLSPLGENFASWYRHIVQEYPSLSFEVYKILHGVLVNFTEIKLKEAGDSRKLQVGFSFERKNLYFGFNDISDGQRQLIMIYFIAAALKYKVCSFLLIDEPDSSISLREVKPWLNMLKDICEETNSQAVVISHHASVINSMSDGSELWFSKNESGQIITGPFENVEGLLVSETIERGW